MRRSYVGADLVNSQMNRADFSKCLLDGICQPFGVAR
jgi:hypothetical protein